jgi:UDP-glucose 4-epimerase
MKRVLVAGAAGFVGSHLARRLLSDGHEVHILMRTTSRTWRVDDILPGVRVAHVDLVDENALDTVVRSIRPQWIFNCAGSGIESFKRTDEEIVRSDFEAAANLVRTCAAQGFEAFVHSGSSTEYGWKDHAPTETEAGEPNSPHGTAKARATAFCSHFAQANASPIVTLRLYTIYGPFESPRRLIPRLVAFGLRDSLPALARPDVARDFVHVDDVVNAYVLAAVNAQKVPGAVFNIGTGRQSCLRDVVDLVRNTMALSAQPRWGTLPDRPYDTTSWRADSSLAREALGWTAAIPLESGIRLFYEWLKSSNSLADLYARESATDSSLR